jgi:hypothetical protein
MARKTTWIPVLVGLGAALLIWIAVAERSEPQAPSPRAHPKARKAEVPSAAAPEAAIPPGPTALPTPTSSPVAGEEDYPLLRERIRRLEERARDLEARRGGLVAANQELERQVREKGAEATAGAMATWRVRMLESLLSLTPDQKQMLTELWTTWLKEDAGGPSSRDTWLVREGDLRARLSVEQTAKLHDSVSTQTRQIWSMMGNSLGSILGASREEQIRFQQTLGNFPLSNSMLLPEPYGADWPGMMKEAAARLRSGLSADQTAKLDRALQRY